MSGVVVRRACLEDVFSIQRLASASCEAPHWSAEKYCEILRPSEGALRREVWVGVLDGTVAGFAVVAVLLDEAEIESIAVNPAFRRLGVGRTLMDFVLQSIQPAGVKEVRLEVRKSNETARCFYKKLRFVENGIRRGYYSDPMEDAVLMCRSID